MRKPTPIMSDAAVLQEFEARYRSMREVLGAELSTKGEDATIRRVLNHGSALERAILLTLLGHCQHMALRLRGADEGQVGEAQQADERAKRFLRGLIGEGERLTKEMLRPAPDAMHDDDVFVLDTSDPNAKLQRRH